MATKKHQPEGEAAAGDGSPKARDAHGGGDLHEGDAEETADDTNGKSEDGSDASNDPKWNRDYISSRNGRGLNRDGSHEGSADDADKKGLK